MSMKSIVTLPAICCGPATEPLALVHERDHTPQRSSRRWPIRRGSAIVNHLSGRGEVCVCNLVDSFDLSQPNDSRTT
jgi:hypothetical protein